jgi:RND family efflux transporter MFP subunit
MKTRAPSLLCPLAFTCILPLRLSAQGQPPAPVEVEAAAEVDFAPAASVLGTTEPRRRSVVAASIEGYVVDYAAREGLRVQQGQVLARLRDDTLRLQLQEAEAALDEVRALRQQAARDLERARKLIGEDAVTRKALDAAETAERTLELRAAQAQARIDVLKADISKKTVAAPFAGQVVREHTEVGEWLAAGGAVATLLDLSTLFVRANVPERHVRFVREGAQLSVSVPAAGKEPFHGTVTSVSDDGDPVSRTFAVRVEVPNDGRLRAGMSARVEVPSGEPRRALSVSKDAILQRGAQSFVYVVGAGGIAEQRPVRLGAAGGGRFEVLEGLQPGDSVVVKGNERLNPGAPLRVQPGSTATRSAK